jgi:hypothetical protein
MESVDDLAKVEQVCQATEAVQFDAAMRRRANIGVICAPIGPLSGNKRAAAIG